MSFVQNFPFFSIILSLVCAVVSFAANARWARRLSIFLLSASVVLQGSLLVYCTVHHVRYSYMMGHYPAPWGNELTAGILEPFLAMLFAGVMLLCVLGGMGRILRDVPADRQKLYWVMVDLALTALEKAEEQEATAEEKEAKKKNAMLSELAVGDTVLTTSGFYGTVIDIADDTVIVEFGNNKNCRIPMQKAAISAVEKPEEAMEK